MGKKPYTANFFNDGLLPIKANKGKRSLCPQESAVDTEAARETTLGVRTHYKYWTVFVNIQEQEIR